MAARFWVGSSGTWDTSSNNWAAADGGAPGSAAAPTSADAVTFSSQSGGGVVTVNTTVVVQSITMGSFTGTLDFGTNNNNVTLTASPGLSVTGTGVRTLNMGSGTWTISVGGGGTAFTFGVVTNLTLSASLSTMSLTGTGGRATNPGAQTFNNLFIGADATGAGILFNAAGSFNSITIGGQANLQLVGTITIASAPTWTGTSSGPIQIENLLLSSAPTTIAISSGVPSLAWTALRNLTFTGSGTGTAVNSLNLGGVTGITVTAPSVGSAIIGG